MLIFTPKGNGTFAEGRDICVSELFYVEPEPVVKTNEDLALDILKTQNTWAAHQQHGQPGTVTYDEDNKELTVPACVSDAYVGAPGAFRGFYLTPAAISAMHDLGFDMLTFTVTTGAGGYFVVYSNIRAGEYSTHNDSNYVATGSGGYYVISGTTITLDLSALSANADFMADNGLMFCVTTSRDWVAYDTDTTITFSDIVFTTAPVYDETTKTFTACWGSPANGYTTYYTSDAPSAYFTRTEVVLPATIDGVTLDHYTKITMVADKCAALAVTFNSYDAEKLAAADCVVIYIKNKNMTMTENLNTSLDGGERLFFSHDLSTGEANPGIRSIDVYGDWVKVTVSTGGVKDDLRMLIFTPKGSSTFAEGIEICVSDFIYVQSSN